VKKSPDENFIAKYNQAGGRERKMGVGMNSNTWEDIKLAVDTNGSMYAVGVHKGKLLVRKYNSSFFLQWSESLPSLTPQGAVVDKVGDLLVSAESYVGDHACVVLKYDGSGYLKWNKSISQATDDYCGALVTDTNLDIYLLKNTNDHLKRPIQSILYKLSSSHAGAILWSNYVGENHIASRVTPPAIDAENYIYITGMIMHVPEFAQFGGNDGKVSEVMFLQKYDASGSLQWETLQGCHPANPDRSFPWISISPKYMTIQSDNVLVGGSTDCKCGNQTSRESDDKPAHTFIMKYSSQGAWQGTFAPDLSQLPKYLRSEMRGLAVDTSQRLYSVHIVIQRDYIMNAYLIKHNS